MKKPVRTGLVEARKRRGWSQRELADYLGSTQHNVSRWEAGLTTPGPYFRAKLCELFEVSAQELGLIDKNPPSSDKREAEGAAAISAPVEIKALWTVPYHRNPHFTGREKLLERLDQQFSTPRNDHSIPPRCAALTQPQAIRGLGGIGKTQIAVEYAYRAREQQRYTHILWINAASEEAILTSFVTLAEAIPAVAATKTTEQHKLVAEVIRWLEHCQARWLLIFDNADEVALLQPYLPQQGSGSLLLTTRAHAVGALAAPIDVETMGLVEGTMFLLHRAQRQHASDDERNEASNIVIALDGFPLALDQAGAYIEETGCSFRDYLQMYQEHHQVLLARRGEQATDYPDAVATTWSLSFERIAQRNPAAAELLHLCAFLAPDAIPEELFIEGTAYWPAVLQQASTDRFAFNQTLEALLRFSFIKRHTEEHVLSLHRLVQMVLRDTMEREEQQQWAERAIQAMNVLFPEQIEVAAWTRCQHYLPQAQVCSALIRDFSFAFAVAASLLQRTARYLREAGLYAQAESLFQQALHIYEQISGPNHPEALDSLDGLAATYQAQGKYREAETLFQQILHIREQALGSDHLDVAQSLDSLARLLNRQGKYREAESLCLRALRIREQTLGSDHLDIAQSLLRLASTYNYQGKYEQARSLYQQVLRIREQALGPDHRQVASVLNDLAEVYRALGEYREAEPLYQQALHIWEQQLGPEHADVAYPLYNLGELYRAQGKYAQAEPLYQRTLHIWEQRLGPEHPVVAAPLNSLAELYRAQGKYTQAEPLYQRALHIREQRLGSDHTSVAEVLIGLAHLYCKQHRFAEAESLFQRAMRIREQQLGPDHFKTAEALHSLAAFQEMQDHLQEAMLLYQRALTIRGQVFGPQHPTTTETSERLRIVSQVMGKMEDAAIREAARHVPASPVCHDSCP